MTSDGCKRKHRIIASFTTNRNDPNRTTWDLTPYRSAGIGTPGGTWRLVEAGAGVVYASGKIAPDGTLVANDYVISPEVNIVSPGANLEDGGGNGSENGGNNPGENGQGTTTPCGLPNNFTTPYDYEGYMELQDEFPRDDTPRFHSPCEQEAAEGCGE